MTPPPTEPNAPLEERKFEQDTADKKRELDLKEREIAAKEREVAVKEAEFDRSRWLNPLVIGLFAAAVGLIGNVVVALVNDSNTKKIERIRSQSSLVLDAIRTGTGNTDAACKNLLALVGLGLLDDPGRTIQQRCDTAPAGPPSLPAQGGLSGGGLSGTNGLLGGFGPLMDVSGTVVDDSGNAIAAASVSAMSLTAATPPPGALTSPTLQSTGGILGTGATTDTGGPFAFKGLSPGTYSIMATKDGFETSSRLVSANYSIGTNVNGITIVLKRNN
jgi:hypothetical protein